METLTNGSAGWRMAYAPADFIEEKLAEIVAFSIDIGRIAGKSKLSQKRDRIDHESVREVMEESGQNRHASRMQAHGQAHSPHQAG